MSSRFYQQRPLEWSTFLKLMEDINNRLLVCNEHERDRLANYQVAIAFGCYLAPNSTELLNLTWRKLKQDKFYYMYEERTPAVVDDHLREIIDKNYAIVKPFGYNRYLLCNNFKGNQPIAAKRFNKVLADIFEQFGIDTPHANFQTLRKTFARKVFLDLSATDEAVEILSNEFGMNPGLMRIFLRVD